MGNTLSKNDYSAIQKHLQRHCSTCQLVYGLPEEDKINKCPYYVNSDDDACAIDKKLSRKIETPQELKDYALDILRLNRKNLEGLEQMMAASGIGYSEDMQKALEGSTKVLKDITDLMQGKQNSISIKATGEAQTQGLLEKIFSANK